MAVVEHSLSMSMAPRTVVLSDLHVVRDTPRAVTDDLADLVSAHAGARLVFLGDLFDLPASSPRRPHRQAVDEALSAHPRARAALARHLDAGGELWLLGGNHDIEIGTAGFDAHLLAALGASPAARLRTSPWFLRDGAVHLEHGHFYDPDNAPAHPLVNGASSLGVHFVEEFIAPAGAHRYLQVNDSTPLRLFLSSFSWFGPRAPYVIYRYFYAAFGALFKSGPFYRAGAEPATGAALVEAFARDLGIDRELCVTVLAHGATPTLESMAHTFSRLYFDRVIATLAITGGLGAAALGQAKGGAAAAALGGLLMVTSWARGHNRYAGTVAERLAESASRIAGATGARLVVFGHTHREAEGESYANTGSFAFPRGAPGRPFLEIEGTEGAPRAVRRYWPATAY
jgi:UDP-2,3-diacylglucosamine pyrophosphatase LpxH